MNEGCKVEVKDSVRVLCLAGRGSSDVDFRKCTNERDGMEGVTNPHHRESVGKFRNQMWCISTLEFDALVKVVDGLSEPQANDQE